MNDTKSDTKSDTKGMGVFHRPPAKLCVIRGGRYYFVDSENRECWENNSRILIYDMNHVQAVLAHHGYALMDDGTTIVPVATPAPTPAPTPTPTTAPRAPVPIMAAAKLHRASKKR